MQRQAAYSVADALCSSSQPLMCLMLRLKVAAPVRTSDFIRYATAATQPVMEGIVHSSEACCHASSSCGTCQQSCALGCAINRKTALPKVTMKLLQAITVLSVSSLRAMHFIVWASHKSSILI